MKVKAFLKINRMDVHGVFCTRYWCEVFKDYETYILCDKFKQDAEPPPAELKSILFDYPHVKVVNSDYTLGEHLGTLKPRKRGMAMANLTGIGYSKDADAFWMIDADDTMFLSHAFDVVQAKLQIAEQQFQERGLDAYSLDFYRNKTNGWTFGIALLSSAINPAIMQTVSGDEMMSYGGPRNIDTAFHVLWKRGNLKCANFVFGGMAFQHTYNNYPEMPQGVYYWNKGHLWEAPLQPDVVTI